MSTTSTCNHCAHCNADEAQATLAIAGTCTLRGGWFNGKRVPVWLTCPMYQPATSPQGDGDQGE